MHIIVEGYKVGVLNNIVLGKKEDRIILYHPSNIEELLKSESFQVTDSIDLLTGRKTVFDLFQLEQFIQIGSQL